MEKRENSLILETNVANRYLFSKTSLARLESFWRIWGVRSIKRHGRLQIAPPLFDEGAAHLLWRVDYVDEDTSQPIATFDLDVFDASSGLTHILHQNLKPLFLCRAATQK